MDLPSTQSVIDFDFTSELGKRYEGQFVVNCLLDMRAKHRLELEKTRLLGNYPNPTDELSGIAIILASLRFRVVKGPSWWTDSDGGMNITDIDCLNELYEKVLVAEVEWRTKLKEKAKAAKEAQNPKPATES